MIRYVLFILFILILGCVYSNKDSQEDKDLTLLILEFYKNNFSVPFNDSNSDVIGLYKNIETVYLKDNLLDSISQQDYFHFYKNIISHNVDSKMLHNLISDNEAYYELKNVRPMASHLMAFEKACMSLDSLDKDHPVCYAFYHMPVTKESAGSIEIYNLDLMYKYIYSIDAISFRNEIAYRIPVISSSFYVLTENNHK